MTDTDGKLISKEEIPVSTGAPGVEETKRWYKQQVPYQNYAGMNEDLDKQILEFVDTTRSTFRSRMINAHQRWAFNWATANGEATTQDREDDVVMPETQKLLNNKIAHMEKSLFGIDPMLEAEGVRQDLGQMKGVVISSYIRRMLELARHRDYFGPAAKDAQLCNYSAIKVTWTRRFGDIINRKTEMKYGEEGQDPYWHDERWMERALVEDAPELHLVDPFWLILDLDAGNVEDLAYIGDESEPFLHTLEEMAELGIYPKGQVKKVRERKHGAAVSSHDQSEGATIVDQFRQARQITAPSGLIDMQPSGGHTRAARRCRATELWAWYDFKEGHDGIVDPLGRKLTGVHKVVITVCNGIVLQFRLNPFDKKFFPYAVAVMNRNGHEMVAPAPFDQVVVMNAQYDRFQSNVLRHLDLSIAPFIVTGPESDLTEPLTALRPGAIMQMPGDFKEVAIKDLPQSVQFFYSFFRREMEELSGKLRVHETPVGTATEVERKLQEQQLLIDRETRVQAEQWRQIALIIYKMAGQFASRAQQFSVIGKAQSILGKTFQVPPSWLQEEVDIRFLGVDSMHTVGQRSAGIQQWMNAWGPLLPDPRMGDVNIGAMARMQWEYMVGPHNMASVFPDPEPHWMSWSQREENDLLRQGLEVPISRHDNHMEHADECLREMERLAEDPATPDFVVNAYAKHAQEHFAAAERQAAEQEAREREAPGPQPGVDGPAAAGGMEAPTKQAGYTPGPPQARTVARTGREGAGTSQSQASEAQ